MRTAAGASRAEERQNHTIENGCGQGQSSCGCLGEQRERLEEQKGIIPVAGIAHDENVFKTGAKRESSALARLFGAVTGAVGNLNILFSQALREPNPIIRRLAFSKLLEAMTPENASAIREQLVNLGADPEQWRDFHHAWGTIDGKAAFDQATARETLRAESRKPGHAGRTRCKTGPYRRPPCGQVADGYARKNPQAAACWLQDIAGESHAARAIGQIGE